MNHKGNNLNILFVTGGTGGHIFPALATYDLLKDIRKNIFFATDKRGLNNKELSSLDPYLINVLGYEGKSFIKKIYSIIFLFYSFLKSLLFIQTNKIRVVIGFGSYVQVPFILAALLLKRKVLLHEGNAVMGRANRIFWKYISIRTSAFNLEAKYKNTLCLGMPVRSEIIKLYKNSYTSNRKNGKIFLLIMGGSQGSKILSKKISQSIIQLPDNLKNRLIISHQVRANDLDTIKSAYDKNKLKYKVATFINDIANELKKANLVISRAGSSTISENAIAGLPVIYFPITNSVGNHQFKNAQVYQEKKAAWIFTEKDLIKGDFTSFLMEIINNKKALKNVAERNKELAKPAAAKKISYLIKSLIYEDF